MNKRSEIKTFFAGMFAMFGGSVPSDIGGVRQDVRPQNRKKNQSKKEAHEMIRKAQEKRERKAQKKNGGNK